MIYFNNTILDKNGKVIQFDAIENDIILGSCALVLEGKFAKITKLTFDKVSPYIAEGLIKSAFNYATIKNYYMAKCSIKDIEALLIRLGFKYQNGEYISDIPTILMGSCKNCSN